MIRHWLRLLAYLLFKREYPEGWGTDLHPQRSSRGGRVIFMCDGFKGHGGITDRLRGLLTTYREAKRLGRPFFVSWTSPFMLEEFLLPASVDWRTNAEDIGRNYADSYPLILDVSPEQWKNIFKRPLFRYGFRCNGGRDVLVYTNMDCGRSEYPTLYRELFRPSEYLQRNIDLHLAALGGRFWAYTFRFGNIFGDFRDIVGRELEGEARQRMLEKNLGELRRLLNELPEGARALVTSDSLFFLTQAEAVDSRIYVVKQQLMHTDFCGGGDVGREVWLKSFVDQNLLMKAERVYLLKTGDMYKSGFPEFAALIGGGEYIFREF